MHVGDLLGRSGPRRILLVAGAGVIALAVTSAAPVVAGVAGAASSKAVTQARNDLLHLSDLPKGWKVTTSTSTSTSTSSTTKAVNEIAKCEAVSNSIDNSAPTARRNFANKNGVEFAFESVVVFPSTKDSKTAYQLFSNAKAPTCVGEQMAKSAASTTSSGITPTKISTSKVSFPKYGSGTTALKVVFNVTTAGHTIPIQADFVVVEQGKLLAIVATVALATAFPTSLAHTLTKKAAGRLH